MERTSIDPFNHESRPLIYTCDWSHGARPTGKFVKLYPRRTRKMWTLVQYNGKMAFYQFISSTFTYAHEISRPLQYNNNRWAEPHLFLNLPEYPFLDTSYAKKKLHCRHGASLVVLAYFSFYIKLVQPNAGSSVLVSFTLIIATSWATRRASCTGLPYPVMLPEAIVPHLRHATLPYRILP